MPAYLPTLNWPIYSGWTAFTPTIPKMYWDVYSQEQRIKELCCNYAKCEQYLDYVAKLTNDWVGEYTDEVQAKLDTFEALVKSGYVEAIDRWIEEDLPGIIDTAVKMVFFGLTDDGYFTAYIPDSWHEIIFDTGFNYTDQNTYGRLMLDMYVTDTFQINDHPTDLIWEVQND